MRTTIAAALVLLIASCFAAAQAPLADTEFRIVSPTSRTLAYGETPIVVDGPPALYYRVYWQRTPGEKGALVCNRKGPPRGGMCRIDAGQDLGSEWLLVEARDDAGGLVAERRVQTYFFQRPVATVRELANPMVEVTVLGPPEAKRELVSDPAAISCTLGGEPCAVLGMEGYGLQGLLRLSMLIDESNSIGREGLEQLIPAVGEFVGLVQQATEGRLAVEHEVVFFAETSRNATFGFTDDPREVEDALVTSAPAGGTCLYEAITDKLRALERWKLLDDYAGRKTSYALIVWSDGQDACPTPATTGDAAIGEATWSEIPIFVVPMPVRRGVRTGSRLPDGEFTRLGVLSGGHSFEQLDTLADALTGEIFERLMNRFVVEIEPASGAILGRQSTLELAGPENVFLHHRKKLGTRRSKREIALRILRDDLSDARAKAVAASLIAREPEPVRFREAERIYRELKQLIEYLRKDMEVQAREQGRDELAQVLRRRRREIDDLLTRKELSVARLLRPADRAEFMQSRNAMLEAIIIAAGRALLWDDDPRIHRRFVGLLERMTAEGYRLANPQSDLSVYIEAYLDPDFPGDPELRESLERLLER